MRLFGTGMLLALSLIVGCEKPIEGIPGPGGSGTSDAGAPKVEMPSSDTKEPAADAPKADAPADAPKTDAPATEPAKTDAPAVPAAEAPKADAPKADAPAAEPPPVEQPAAPKSADAAAPAAKFVSTKIKVPTMSCPHGCWPTVKETLAKQPGVEAVELTKQAKEDAIDNPVVIVKFQGKFDSDAAIAALAKAGFDKAEVAN